MPLTTSLVVRTGMRAFPLVTGSLPNATGAVAVDAVAISDMAVSQHPEARRPKLIWFNAVLVVTLLVWGILPLSVPMMLAFAIVIIVNYPDIVDQKERFSAHAGNVLAVVSLIFAACIFTGIWAAPAWSRR